VRRARGVAIDRRAAAACALAAFAAPASGAAGDDLGAAAARLAGQAERAGKSVVEGREGWLFFAPELRHLAHIEGAARPAPEALAAITDFAAQLKAAGVELVVAPVPAKAQLYAERLPGGAKAPAAGGGHARFLRALADAGVSTIDLLALFDKEKDPRGGAPLYCSKDTHWSGRGLEIAARVLGDHVKGKPWYAALPRATYEGEPRTIDITGDLARSAGQTPPPRESIALRAIGRREGGRLAAVPPDRESPVVLLGDSHNLVFHAGGDLFATGAGLPDHLAGRLGFPLDVVAVRGAGATAARVNLARRVRADTGYLARKKIVLWVFAARELTQGAAWQKVPVTVASAR
jgi:alginate O-acetyltransferase complex protein AlgJ